MPFHTIFSLTSLVSLAFAPLLSAGEQYLVKYSKPGSGIAGALESLNGTLVADYPKIGVAVVTSGRTDLDFALAPAPGVEYLVRDRRVRWLGDPPGASVAPVPATAALGPFDAKYLPFQWNLFSTQANLAWGVTQGARPVTVAVVDTGICAHHVDLQGKVDVAWSKSFVPESSDCPPAQQPACIDCPDWEDRHFHGTHVASLITTNYRGSAGIAPNVRLRAIKVSNCRGEGDWSWLIGGLMYAADTGNELINVSLGSMFREDDFGAALLIQTLREVISYAESKGALVVSASGNEGKNLDRRDGTVSMPCQAGGLCVGATTRSDALAQFSNHGLAGPQMVAPGGGSPLAPFPKETWNEYIIGSCSRHSVKFPGCGPADAILFVNGTSQAAPQVAGAAALVLGVHPLNSLQTKEKIIGAADDLGPSGADQKFGSGRLNVYRAVQ